jgi:hypothetical protein
MYPFVFFMIIWSLSHVYDLFVVAFVADLYHCYYGLSPWRGVKVVSRVRKRLIWMLWLCQVRETAFLSRIAES